VNRNRLTEILLAAVVAWAAFKIHAAGVTGWPFSRAVLLPASWGTAAGVLAVGIAFSCAAFTAIGGGWRPRI
jgi:hypothetical protein